MEKYLISKNVEGWCWLGEFSLLNRAFLHKLLCNVSSRFNNDSRQKYNGNLERKSSTSYHLITWESQVPNSPYIISPLNPFSNLTRLYILREYPVLHCHGLLLQITNRCLLLSSQMPAHQQVLQPIYLYIEYGTALNPNEGVSSPSSYVHLLPFLFLFCKQFYR